MMFKPVADELKKIFVWVGVVYLSLCSSLGAEPLQCPMPTETDSWYMETEATPELLLLDECKLGQKVFRVNGFYAPFTLMVETDTGDWVEDKTVQKEFLYSNCDNPHSCDSKKIRIVDAKGHSSNAFELIDYLDVEPLEYSPSNPESVDPSITSQVTISVTGGAYNYIWNAAGDGFSFMYNATETPSNTLIISPDACGEADITVMSICDTITDGSIRSTNGQWDCYDTCTTGYEMYAYCSSWVYQGQCNETYWVSPTEKWEILRQRWSGEGAGCPGPPYGNPPCDDIGSCTPPNNGNIVFTQHVAKYRWVCQ